MDFLSYLQSSRKDYLRISIRPLLLQYGIRFNDVTAKKYWRDMIGERMEITVFLIFCQNILFSLCLPKENKFSFEREREREREREKERDI